MMHGKYCGLVRLDMSDLTEPNALRQGFTSIDHFRKSIDLSRSMHVTMEQANPECKRRTYPAQYYGNNTDPYGYVPL